jgi:hypothetical protein
MKLAANRRPQIDLFLGHPATPRNRIDDLQLSYPCRILNLWRRILISEDPNNSCGRNAHAMLAAQLLVSAWIVDLFPPPVMHNCLRPMSSADRIRRCKYALTALPDILGVRLFHILFCADRMCGAEGSGEADRVGDLDEAVGEGFVAMYIQPPNLSARVDLVRLSSMRLVTHSGQ